MRLMMGKVKRSALTIAKDLVKEGKDEKEVQAALELLDSDARYLVVQHPSSIRLAEDKATHGEVSRDQLISMQDNRILLFYLPCRLCLGPWIALYILFGWYVTFFHSFYTLNTLYRATNTRG
jgi:hypothetical protein